MNPRYVPLSEGAEYLSITVAGLRKYIAEGRITGYRLGKRSIRVDVRELDELLTPIPAVMMALIGFPRSCSVKFPGSRG